MPREVWDPAKPSAAFTPRQQPLSKKHSTNKSDFMDWKNSPILTSSNQETTPSGLPKGKPATGITYTPPQSTKDLNEKIKESNKPPKSRPCPPGWTGTMPNCTKVRGGPGPENTPECRTDQDCGTGKKCKGGKCAEEATSCFVDGVQVELADGSKKNVSKISIGDIVKTQEGSGSVVKVFPAKAGNQLLYGFNGKDPFVTEAHPFMTQDGWKKISDVKEGDILYRNGLGNQVVESIESKEIPEDTPVYNFHVDNHENYYADGYLVHNKTEPCKGVMHKGVCHTRCEDTMGEEYTGTHPNCRLKSEAGGGGGEVSGDDAIVKGGQLPDLVSITGEMDIRNMLGNILNKNNPLFKQARTRALQAMAARGIVNSSMAEESVMNAIMNVAVPIAQQASADLQKAMYANQNASNEFKLALNNAYASEMLARVNNAASFNLGYMKEGMTNWRAYMEALTGAKDIKTDSAMKRYLDQISGAWTARV